jgi:hypothetical protein
MRSSPRPVGAISVADLVAGDGSTFTASNTVGANAAGSATTEVRTGISSEPPEPRERTVRLSMLR